MVSITKKFNEKSETKVTPLDIWKHLNTLWDMAEVERLVNHLDFLLWFTSTGGLGYKNAGI